MFNSWVTRSNLCESALSHLFTVSCMDLGLSQIWFLCWVKTRSGHLFIGFCSLQSRRCRFCKQQFWVTRSIFPQWNFSRRAISSGCCSDLGAKRRESEKRRKVKQNIIWGLKKNYIKISKIFRFIISWLLNMLLYMVIFALARHTSILTFFKGYVRWVSGFYQFWEKPTLLSSYGALAIV